MIRAGRRVAVTIGAMGCVLLAGCSDSETPVDETVEEPVVGGINGPAEVDPSFNPFEVDGTNVP